MSEFACQRRDIREQDHALILQWWNDIEIQYLTGHWRGEWSPERLLKRTQTSPEIYRGWVVTAPDGAAIGTVELAAIELGQRRADLRLILGEKGWWGKGVAVDVARDVLQFAFSELDLQRVQIQIPSYNERGMRWAAKVGFVEEGRLRRHLNFMKKEMDVVLFAMLRDEFL